MRHVYISVDDALNSTSKIRTASSPADLYCLSVSALATQFGDCQFSFWVKESGKWVCLSAHSSSIQPDKPQPQPIDDHSNVIGPLAAVTATLTFGCAIWFGVVRHYEKQSTD